MFTPRCVTFLLVCFLLPAGSTSGGAAQREEFSPRAGLAPISSERLANGIRLVHLPAAPDAAASNLAEVAFGYTAGIRNEPGYPRGVADLAELFVSSSVAARSVALAAHLGGGRFDFVAAPDQFGMRVVLPRSLVQPLLNQVASYFGIPDIDPELFEYARGKLRLRSVGDTDDSDRRIRAEIGSALLRDYPYRWSDPPSLAQIDGLQSDELKTYFRENLGTDRAFIVVSESIPAETRLVLEAVEKRVSSHSPASAELDDGFETSLSFPSGPEGGVVVATAVPSVHFESWFSALVVDRMLRFNAEPSASFEFSYSVDPVLHSIEIPVRVPLFSDDVRDDILGLIDALQFQRPDPEQLREAVESARAFLLRSRVRQWFAAQDLWGVLEAGLEAVDRLTGDGFRAAARDFAAHSRVTATWAPAFEQPRVTVEGLDEAVQPVGELPRSPGRAPGRVTVPSFDATGLPEPPLISVERLQSGVTVAEDSDYAVFVAGRSGPELLGGEARVGSNGTLWSFRSRPDEEVFEQLSDVRPDRLLFLAPETDLSRLRARLAGWVSGTRDTTPSLAEGPVSSGDLPSLLVLKVWLDAKLIEAGWWGDVDLRIDGTRGAALIIDADPEREVQIREWIRAVGEAGIEEDEFLRVRSAATGLYDRIRTDLKILLWQKDPGGTLPLPLSVNQARLRDVATIYF